MSEVIVLTPTGLDQIVRNAIISAVNEIRAAAAPEAIPDVMTKAQLAKYLQCDVSKVGRLMKDGRLPYFMYGDQPRFRKAKVDSHLDGDFQEVSRQEDNGSREKLRQGDVVR